jgi:putative acetyltransferase
MITQPEKPDDIPAIFELNVAAFGQDTEARLVDALRAAGAVLFSLVAEVNEEIVGHILFSMVTVQENPDDKKVCRLAPLAVKLEFEKQGVGSALVKAGFSTCFSAGLDAVVVLGSHDCYPRFGFFPAHQCGLKCEYPAPLEDFMVINLTPNGLSHCSGLVKYHPLFNEPGT